MSNKKRVLNGLLAVVMFMTMLIPFVSNAVVEPTPTANFTIQKFRPIDGQPPNNGEEQTVEDKYAVPGVGFKINQTHSFTIVNGVIKGVAPVASSEIIRYTDANGKIELTNLPVGRYTFQELTATEYEQQNKPLPTGIVIPTAPKEYTVELPGTKANGELFYDVFAYPKNEDNAGQVTIEKKVRDPKADTASVFEGAKFEVYDKVGDNNYVKLTHRPMDGTAYPNDGVFTTDGDGKVTIGGLEDGKKYYLREISTGKDDVAMGTREYIEFTAGDDVTVDFMNNKIVKAVTDETPSIGTEYEYKVYSVVPEDIAGLETFEISDDIQPIGGNYVGYIKGDIELKIGGEVVTIPEGKYTPRKNDIAGSIDGSEIGEEVTGFTLDLKELAAEKADQIIEIKYTAVLTDAAVNKTVYNKVVQTINDTTITTNKPVTPKNGKIILTKEDLENANIKLEGAKFQLEKKVGNNWVAIGTEQFTDENGNITWNNLAYGQYRLFEKTAPTFVEDGETKSYIIIDEYTEVEVDGIEEVTVKNRKPKWYLPDTGGMGYYIFTALSIVLLAGGLGLYTYKKKEVSVK